MSLIISAYANYRQKTRLAKHKLLHQLRRSADHYAELSSLIDNISIKKSIAAELIGMAIQNYQRIESIDSNTAYNETSLQTAQEFAQSLPRSRKGYATESFFLNSDLEIYRVKSMLNDIEKLFRRMLKRDDLSKAVFDDYHRELVWLYLQVEVDSLVHHGNLAKQRKDKVKSLSYYQKALNVMKKSSVIDPRKQDRIKAISEILSGKNEPDTPTEKQISDAPSR